MLLLAENEAHIHPIFSSAYDKNIMKLFKIKMHSTAYDAKE